MIRPFLIYIGILNRATRYASLSKEDQCVKIQESESSLFSKFKRAFFGSICEYDILRRCCALSLKLYEYTNAAVAKGTNSERKEFAPSGANSFLLEMIPGEKEANWNWKSCFA